MLFSATSLLKFIKYQRETHIASNKIYEGMFQVNSSQTRTIFLLFWESLANRSISKVRTDTQVKTVSLLLSFQNK